jgi:peptide/nickel transport system permease protein
MGKYLLGKLGRAVLTIIAVVTFAFLTLHAAGDPAVVMLSPDTPPEVLDAFRREWGLDQPLWQQYLTYWGNILHGNFGESMRSDRPALELIMDRLPATLTLMLPALVFKIGLGIPLGILAALNRNTWIDRVTIAGAVFSHAVPNFVMGFLLVILFSVTLHWLSSGGFEKPTDLILPIVTLGTSGAAIIARFTRSAMVDVLGQPYVRAAQAKGLPWSQVILTHVLPNAAIPTLTIVGLMVGSLVAGSVIVETIFSWPGVGRLLILSVSTRDLPVVQTLLILIAGAMVAANLTVDFLYGVIDPRVRLATATRTK